MLKFSVCIDMIYKDVSLENSLKELASIGYKAFEFWGWCEKNIERLVILRKKFQLKISAFSIDSDASGIFNNWDKGALVNPINRKAFLNGLKETMPIAKKLGCNRLIVTTGNLQKNMNFDEQKKSLIEGLKEAVPIIERENIILLLEPLNLMDHPGYFLSFSKGGFDIIKEVDSPNVKLLFDIYHQQITEGNLIQTIIHNLSKIGHFHVADVPGRHEPGTGEVNYKNIFIQIEQSGFDGYIGLEFLPSTNSKESLLNIFKSFAK